VVLVEFRWRHAERLDAEIRQLVQEVDLRDLDRQGHKPKRTRFDGWGALIRGGHQSSYTVAFEAVTVDLSPPKGDVVSLGRSIAPIAQLDRAPAF
jgi:hypothetical protein